MKTWIPLSLVTANGLESKDFCRPLEQLKDHPISLACNDLQIQVFCAIYILDWCLFCFVCLNVITT
jgi:hypothetical protein